MTLVKHNPSTPSLGGWMDDFFSGSLFSNSDWRNISNRVPAVNIKDNADNYLLELAAPGLEKKDFEVTVDNGLLTISSKKEVNNEQSDENYTRREFSYTAFTRTFSLPEGVKQDAVAANYTNGVLHVTLPKTDAAKTKPARSIKIS